MSYPPEGVHNSKRKYPVTSDVSNQKIDQWVESQANEEKRAKVQLSN